tara:strand:- start:15092 stop:15571 length:480 start_codon:yes stop_codon:yes gene_type:complete
MIVQMSLFHIDEYYFHRRRKVKRSEIVNALIDGSLYVLPLCIAVFTPFTMEWRIVFIVLASISCISIAKNEYFYPKLDRQERLVHSFLYVLHPILLYTFYISWQEDFFNKYPYFWIVQITYLGLGLRTLAHQLIYWNYIYSDDLHEQNLKNDSHPKAQA